MIIKAVLTGSMLLAARECQDFCVKSHTLPERARKEYGQKRYEGIFC